MQSIASFEKVSFEQYKKDRPEASYEEWECIKLPVRSTAGSAGYDFFIPYQPTSPIGDDPVKLSTGIRCKIEPGWVLILVPRSGLGFKHGMRLVNTVGVIDQDYYYADNEGHIMAKISASDPFWLHQDDRFMQGIFLPYGVAAQDAPLSNERTGGFGSTGK